MDHTLTHTNPLDPGQPPQPPVPPQPLQPPVSKRKSMRKSVKSARAVAQDLSDSVVEDEQKRSPFRTALSTPSSAPRLSSPVAQSIDNLGTAVKNGDEHLHVDEFRAVVEEHVPDKDRREKLQTEISQVHVELMDEEKRIAEEAERRIEEARKKAHGSIGNIASREEMRAQRKKAEADEQERLRQEEEERINQQVIADREAARVAVMNSAVETAARAAQKHPRAAQEQPRLPRKQLGAPRIGQERPRRDQKPSL